MAVDCPGDHTHASWQAQLIDGKLKYPTAEEAEYPRLMCKRLASCVAEQATQRGLTLEVTPKLKRFLQLSINQQTRHHAPLMPEFKQFVHLDQPSNEPYLKLLVTPPTQGPNTESPKRSRTTYKYGVWRNPSEFLEEAMTTSHPVDSITVAPITQDAIDFVVKKEPVDVAKYRLRTIIDDVAIKDKMENKLKERLCKKNLALFQHLMKVTDYPDREGVMDLLTNGVPLVGCDESPTGFDRLVCPATLTPEELLKSSPWRRKAIMGASKAVNATDISNLVDTSQDEVDRGFLEGPYTESEMSSQLGQQEWLLNPRFVLYQGENAKVRIIDDAKVSSLNAAYTSVIRLQLQDSDYIAAMAMEVARAAKHSHQPERQWLGKTYDLKKAYKQLGIFPPHRPYAVVGFATVQQWQFYQSIALPFGATGSVYGFVRVSQALWHVISVTLKAIISHYFDDFPTIECSEGTKILDAAIHSILDILGWDFARSTGDDKAHDFQQAFDALGVTFDLSSLHQHRLTVANKRGRIDRIVAMLKQVEAQGTLSVSQASEVQGLINFATSFFVSRAFRHLISAFARVADGKPEYSIQQIRSLCQYAISWLPMTKPREHFLSEVDGCVHIFTDGAWESDVASGGFVLVDSSSGLRIAAAIDIPRSLIELWKSFGAEQIISQIELYALVAVRFSYRKHLQGRKVVAWIDNTLLGHQGQFTIQVNASHGEGSS